MRSMGLEYVYYIPTFTEFTIKKKTNVGKYTIITLDPMGLKPKMTALNVYYSETVCLESASHLLHV